MTLAAEPKTIAQERVTKFAEQVKTIRRQLHEVVVGSCGRLLCGERKYNEQN